MWGGVLNKTKKSMVFRQFRGDMIHVGVDYGDDIQRGNISDMIAGVVSEEESEIITIKKSIIKQGIKDWGWAE